MFTKEQILEFLTKIIKKTTPENIEKSKESINKFREYLKLTTMCEDEVLESISTVESCLLELVQIYKKTNICDLSSMFNLSINNNDTRQEELVKKIVNKTKDNNSLSKKPKQLRKKYEFRYEDEYDEKHYERYIPVSDTKTASSCTPGAMGSIC